MGDPATGSVLVGDEDRALYRWNLSTNGITPSTQLTEGIGRASTPTMTGAEGKVRAIHNATLFAVGTVTELGTPVYALFGLGGALAARRRRAGAQR